MRGFLSQGCCYQSDPYRSANSLTNKIPEVLLCLGKNEKTSLSSTTHRERECVMEKSQGQNWNDPLAEEQKAMPLSMTPFVVQAGNRYTDKFL